MNEYRFIFVKKKLMERENLMGALFLPLTQHTPLLFIFWLVTFIYREKLKN